MIDLSALKELMEKASPIPWFWDSYSKIFSGPIQQQANTLEFALDERNAPEEEYESVPESYVLTVQKSGHGDLPTKQGDADARFIGCNGSSA